MISFYVGHSKLRRALDLAGICSVDGDMTYTDYDMTYIRIVLKEDNLFVRMCDMGVAIEINLGAHRPAPDRVKRERYSVCCSLGEINKKLIECNFDKKSLLRIDISDCAIMLSAASTTIGGASGIVDCYLFDSAKWAGFDLNTSGSYRIEAKKLAKGIKSTVTKSKYSLCNSGYMTFEKCKNYYKFTSDDTKTFTECEIRDNYESNIGSFQISRHHALILLKFIKKLLKIDKYTGASMAIVEDKIIFKIENAKIIFDLDNQDVDLSYKNYEKELTLSKSSKIEMTSLDFSVNREQSVIGETLKSSIKKVKIFSDPEYVYMNFYENEQHEGKLITLSNCDGDTSWKSYLKI